MSETKGISAQVSPELHARVKAEHTELELTISQYITLVLEEHFNGKGMTSMETKTLACQVETALMDRIDSYLAKHPGLTKKAFIIGLIEKALDEAEEASAAAARENEIEE